MTGSTKLMTPSGGGILIQPASSIASDVTVNVPSQNCTLGIQGPAFSAYAASAQTISSGTWTKVQINTKEFDTNSNFDPTTNFRFTPTVAGYYQVNGQATVSNSNTNAIAAVYKNGSLFKRGSMNPTNTFSYGNSLSALVYLNGTTDYIELYTIHNLGANGNLATGADVCYFQASMVRSA